MCTLPRPVSKYDLLKGHMHSPNNSETFCSNSETSINVMICRQDKTSGQRPGNIACSGARANPQAPMIKTDAQHPPPHGGTAARPPTADVALSEPWGPPEQRMLPQAHPWRDPARQAGRADRADASNALVHWQGPATRYGTLLIYL